MSKANEQIQLTFKHVFDVLISLIGLILLAIPFALIDVAIKLDDGGPVFFRQLRAGHHGRDFRVWKFRTMIHDAQSKGLGNTVVQDDDRITRVGQFLRNLGLDELPQLLNVLATRLASLLEQVRAETSSGQF